MEQSRLSSLDLYKEAIMTIVYLKRSAKVDTIHCSSEIVSDIIILLKSLDYKILSVR